MGTIGSFPDAQPIGASTSVHPKTRRRLALLFSIPLAFSLVFFLVNQGEENRETRLLQIEGLSASVAQLRSNARDAESGERGYILTHEERYLTPLKQSRDSLESLISQAIQHADQRPKYRPQVDVIVQLARRHLNDVLQTLEKQRTPTQDPVELSNQLQRSDNLMVDLRTRTRKLLDQLNSEELALLESQQQFSRWSFAFFSVSSLLMIGIIVWLYNEVLKYLGERDAATANLQAANIYLESRIDERTRDLKQANEELQQFAYVASHDLQEPLRTITSFSQLLVLRYKGQLGDEADEFIGYIVSASRRMTDLINGLLAMARLRKAGQPTTPVCFEELLEQSEISLQASIRESKAQVEHGSLPCLVVDGVQFSQVLQNLISNAIKYRRDELPLVRVDAQRENTHWTFSFSDNGRGFDQQFAERIFGLFQRLPNSEEGTGMGLAIARRIVERHGGRMWAQSTEGVGSTFFFSLPVTLEATRDRTDLVPSEETSVRV
jgi:signal transduction histidine kinase